MRFNFYNIIIFTYIISLLSIGCNKLDLDRVVCVQALDIFGCAWLSMVHNESIQNPGRQCIYERGHASGSLHDHHGVAELVPNLKKTSGLGPLSGPNIPA